MSKSTSKLSLVLAAAVQDQIVGMYERKAKDPDDISAKAVLKLEQMSQTAIQEMLTESKKPPSASPADPVAELNKLAKQFESATTEEEKHQLAEQMLKLMMKLQYTAR